ncbi:Rv1733c family protein [Actinomadura chokoriensis]|uniref:DUF3592 domain-containing protein n=1 Tax=Actinomadura chokoriensis TaxID=454156 RepID=A0ABV4QRT4_9ACTN
MERLGHVRRRFGFDRNDLRRTVDRRQWAVGAGAAVLFAGLAPPASVAVAVQSYRTGVEAEQRQAAYHRVEARVTRVKPREGAGVRRPSAELAWTSPDDRPHTAVIPADTSVKPGTSHRIWVDGSGALVRAPRTRADTVATTTVSGTMAVAVVGLPLLAVYFSARRRYDRRREAMWDESWAALAHRETF